MAARLVVVVIIATIVTPVFVVNAFRVLSHDWYVRYEVERLGASDRYGLSQPQRLELALTGLRSIQPESEGIALLEEARLPDGSKAFDERELRHMGDVRVRLEAAFRAQLAAVAALFVLAVVLVRSPRWRTVVPRGLRSGSIATLAVAVLAVPLFVLGFDRFLLRFHEIFFRGSSWRFSDTDTLLRLYPEAFWQHTALIAAAIVVTQAVALAVLSHLWLRRVLRLPRSPG